MDDKNCRPLAPKRLNYEATTLLQSHPNRMQFTFNFNPFKQLNKIGFLKTRIFTLCQALNLILWQASILTGIAVVYGIADLRMNTTLFISGATEVESLFYHCFHKIGWSLALAWVIFSCVNGYGGKFFIPVSNP